MSLIRLNIFILFLLIGCSNDTKEQSDLNSQNLQKTMQRAIDEGAESNRRFEVLTHRTLPSKRYGQVDIYFVWIEDPNAKAFRKIAEELVKDDSVACVYFYKDSTVMPKSRYFNDIDKVLPEDSFLVKYFKGRDGYLMQVSN